MFEDIVHPDGDGYPRRDAAFRRRVVEEVLDAVDFYWAGEGPWQYKSLTVERTMNRIYVSDVDGATCEYLEVPDLTDVAAPHQKLMAKLDAVHEREMAQL